MPTLIRPHSRPILRRQKAPPVPRRRVMPLILAPSRLAYAVAVTSR